MNVKKLEGSALKKLARPRFLLSMLWLAIAIGLLIYIALPQRPTKEETQKLNQIIGPLSIENKTAEEALRTIVRSATAPVSVRLCRELSRKPVTVHIQSDRLEDVLRELARQMDCRFQPYVGIESTLAVPTFPCPDGPQDLIMIDSQR